MTSFARTTRSFRRPSLDMCSENPSSLPSKGEIEERWSVNARNGDRTSSLPYVSCVQALLPASKIHVCY